MFTVYCPGHHRQVLLFPEHIAELVNRIGGIDVRWQCPCGATGTKHMSQSGLSLEVA